MTFEQFCRERFHGPVLNLVLTDSVYKEIWDYNKERLEAVLNAVEFHNIAGNIMHSKILMERLDKIQKGLDRYQVKYKYAYKPTKRWCEEKDSLHSYEINETKQYYASDKEFLECYDYMEFEFYQKIEASKVKIDTWVE